MALDINRDPDLEWLDHVPPVGLVAAPTLLKELGLIPSRQSAIETGEVAEIIGDDPAAPALSDPWDFVEKVLGWEARYVAGSPGGPPIPNELLVALPEHNTTLAPTWAVAELGTGERRWQLLVRIEARGVDPDSRNALDGWEATAHQRFERLLRDTGVFAGLLISEREERKDGQVRTYPEFRLIYAPRGETSGHQSFPIRPMALVSGRPMLGGLKLLLDRFRLFSDGDDRRLPALLKRSREAQALVSTALAEQVLGALHELLRGLDAAEPMLVRDLSASRPEHLYEGLLTVLMRLVFVLYAEDRDLLPSMPSARAREVYETSYSVRGLYAKLTEDATLNPDTMDERRGGWGGLLALFRMIHKGHRTGFVQARGGKLFDPDEFPFLEGRATKDDAPRILHVSDGCLLRILEGLMTIKLRGSDRERLSYRTLDVEQIGSVYETVMGFTVEAATSRVLAIKAGKNNKTPVFVALDALLAKKGKDRIKSLKEDAGRTLTAAQAKAVEEAKTVEDLGQALDNIVDERGSPKKHIAPAGTPILQPTGERRRTGSHYTPRSLTAPIIKHALEPAFARLGPDATPEQVLELKVCDPAMGSGAFLVEACRALGERLVAAWTRWPLSRPKIPADEDEELHARRLVAQRCLYGVDKNPRAVDLARLSLWLATLARDHEFTFLDHALKCGDSLVGLTTGQIAAANWDESKPGLPLFRQLVRDVVAKAMQGRAEIQNAPDDTMRAIQEARHRHLESEVSPIRTMGDAVVSAFFAADKAKAREKARADVESHISGMPPRWDLLEAAAVRLHAGEHGVMPFHWQVEFPEVFARENGGFGQTIGNALAYQIDQGSNSAAQGQQAPGAGGDGSQYPIIGRFAEADTGVRSDAPTPEEQALADSGSGQITVRSGQTLSEIAAFNGTTVAALASLNGIDNPDYIQAGQVLALPGNDIVVMGGIPSDPGARAAWYMEKYGATADQNGNVLGSLSSNMQMLAQILRHGEGNYESYNTGTYHVPGGRVGHSYVNPPVGTVTGRTINQILSTESLPGTDSNRMFAVGAYQITIPTLRGAVFALGLTGNEFLTPQLQDQIFSNYLVPTAGNGALANLLNNGTGTVDAAQFAAAHQWASVAVPVGYPTIDGSISNGRMTYYGGPANMANNGETLALRAFLNGLVH